MDTKADVFDPSCPSRVLLDRIAEKWTGLVVLALSEDAPRHDVEGSGDEPVPGRGPTLRFGQLRTRIGGVAPKVLTQTLRNLERDGLIHREVFAEVPPRVEYSLTPLGRSLRRPLLAVQTWAEEHAAAVLAARARAEEAADVRPWEARRPSRVEPERPTT